MARLEHAFHSRNRSGRDQAANIDSEIVHEAQALRSYDAVHLAAALQVVDAELVLVAGDRALLAAAESVGLMITAIG